MSSFLTMDNYKNMWYAGYDRKTSDFENAVKQKKNKFYKFCFHCPKIQKKHFGKCKYENNSGKMTSVQAYLHIVLSKY